jgi:bacteriocin-like protein
MKLQELTTDELMNIEGGGLGNFIYDVFYVMMRSTRIGHEIAASLRSNPHHGNAMVYK